MSIRNAMRWATYIVALITSFGGKLLMADGYPQTMPPSVTAASSYRPSNPADRLVGVAYSTWHKTASEQDWGKRVWGTPTVGFYASNDRAVIRQHATWLADAGVDFIWVDWSNNIKYLFDPNKSNPTFDMIEGATHDIFDEYTAMRAAGQKTPNISIFAGVTGSPGAAFDGRLQKKVDQIYTQYVADPKYRPLVQCRIISASRCS